MGELRWMLVCDCVVGKGRFGHLKLKLIFQDHRSRQRPLPGGGKPLQPKLCLVEIFLCLLLQVPLFFFVLVSSHNFLPSATSPKINRQVMSISKNQLSLLIDHFLCYGSKQKLTNQQQTLSEVQYHGFTKAKITLLFHTAIFSAGETYQEFLVIFREYSTSCS